MKGLISPNDTKMLLSTYDLSTPIERVSDRYIVFEKCKPHDCPDNSAMIVIDTQDAHVWIGFFSRKEKSVSTRWYGSADDYLMLPENILEKFRKMHEMQ
jgi:hypothetical protein